MFSTNVFLHAKRILVILQIHNFPTQLSKKSRHLT